MYTPLSLFIGLRYTRAKRRNQFISFVSWVSLLGMILGVMALVVVLSVMNGFEGELRGRILSVVPHAYVDGADDRLDNWQHWLDQLRDQPSVTAAAPYIDGSVMLSRPGMVRAAQLFAVSPTHERQVSLVADKMVAGSIDALQPGRYGVVIGDLLARYMGLTIGDELTVMLPKVTVTPVGVFPRVKRFYVVGVFSVGAQLDSDTLFIHLTDGQKLFQLGSAVRGLRLKLDDLFNADAQLSAMQPVMPEGAVARSWVTTQGSLFHAVKMEKTMVTLLLLIIVAIAAFNIVSILTMMVADKRSDIAVLRTMGASPISIMRIFIIQGVAISLLGVGVGLALGVPVAIHIGSIVSALESLLGGQVFNPQVYFISRIPSELEWGDVSLVCCSALLLSFLATIYPAYRATRVQPAEVLRYE